MHRSSPNWGGGGPLRIPASNNFDNDSRDELLRIASESTAVFSPSDALGKFHSIRLQRDGGGEISGIEFLLATVDREGGYFSLRMCRINTIFDLASTQRFFSTGAMDYEYIFRCCLEFEGQGLVDSFFSEFNDVWFGLKMVPDLEVPLTHRGHELVRYLWGHLQEYISVEVFEHLGHSDAESIAREIADFAQCESDRLDRSDRTGVVPR